MKYIIDKTQYLAVKAAWKEIKEKSSVDHIFYNVLRGFDPVRGFTPVISEIKLRNGRNAWQSFSDAKREAMYLIKTPNVYSGEKPERTIANYEAYTKKLAGLSAKYGVEFSPDLVKQIEEVLK